MKNIYMADFETTVLPDNCKTGQVEVWLWATMSLDYTFNYGTDIASFIEAVFDGENKTIEFFNLSFDMSYIFVELNRLGVTFLKENVFDKDTKVQDNQLATCIGTTTIFKVKCKYNNTIVEFSDTRNYSGGSLANWGKIFDIPKGDTPLLLEKPSEIKQEWIDYIKRDVEIQVKICTAKIADGDKGMTTAAIALNDFKKTLEYDEDVTSSTIREYKLLLAEAKERFEQFNSYENELELKIMQKQYNKVKSGKVTKSRFYDYFPQLKDSLHFDRLESYRGGYCNVNPKFRNKELTQVYGYDITSSYPTQMYYKELPIGKPEYSSIPKGLWIAKMRIYGKYHKYPTLLINGTYPMLLAGEYTINSVDYARLMKVGDFTCEVIGPYECYKSSNTIFRPFIDKWIKAKTEAREAGDKLKEAKAKLKLNSLYGKFGTKPMSITKIPYVADNIVKFECTMTKKATVYLPVAAFCTSYAREQLFEAYDLIGYENVIYSDTDSVYSLVEFPEHIVGKHLGGWTLEGCYSRGKFYNKKTYKVEKDGKAIVKAAGINAKFSEDYEAVDLGPGAVHIVQRSRQVVGGKAIYKTETTMKDIRELLEIEVTINERHKQAAREFFEDKTVC